MSDNEGGGRKGGYRLEYSANNRSKCKGPKPCAGTPITKGEIRVGSLVDFKGHTSFAWRHWGCVTPKIITNMKEIFNDADELDGFEDLKEADQEKIRKAWEEGHVDDADIPDSARKPAKDEENGGDAEEHEQDEEEEEEEVKVKKSKGKKAQATDVDGGGKGNFKLEYASSARAKCKKCGESIGKNFFRLGNEVDYRGNKSFAWSHWGCSSTFIQKLKSSYTSPSEIEGFSSLKDTEKDKVTRAFEEGDIPEEDRGIGEAVVLEGSEQQQKKKAVRRKKKKVESGGEDDEEGEEEEERPKKRVRKTKKDEDDDDEPKPKKRSAAATTIKKPSAASDKKKPSTVKKPATKPAAPKKKKAAETEESGEDFGAELDNVSAEEEEEEEEDEGAKKKRKRPPPKPKASSSNTKPAPKATSKPASKKAAKPASRARKPVVEYSDDDDDLED